VADAVTHSLVTALRAVPVLSSFDEHTLLEIVGASMNLVWRRGSSVFEPGAEAQALYIVLSGEVRIFARADGEEMEVARMGPGEFFGELSLLFETTHSKTALAVTDAELMAIPKESFHSLMAANPEVAEIVRRKAAERYPARAAELSRLP
jgi:CRP-like cAMP-binding protein